MLQFILFLVLLSFSGKILEYAHVNSIYKYLADNGYKVDRTKLKMSSKSALIPGFNMFFIIKQVMSFNSNKYRFADNYRIKGFLIPLNKEEEHYYNEKPSFDRAYEINLGIKTKALSITYINDNIDSNTIYYVIENGNYIITKVKGPDKDLSIIELRCRLLEELNYIKPSKENIEAAEVKQDKQPLKNYLRLKKAEIKSENNFEDKEGYSLTRKKDK